MSASKDNTGLLGVGHPALKSSNSLHLACRECQRKKVKCDRIHPCGPCSRAGFTCKPSTRKPRARADKGVDAELRERILKLERLVGTFQGDNSVDEKPIESRTNSVGQSSSSAQTNAGSPGSPSIVESASPNTTKYVAGNFWSSLTTEVKALAEAFEEDAYDSDDDESPDLSPPSVQGQANGDHPNTNAGFEFIFCPPGAIYIMPGASTEPEPILAMEMFNAYLRHVEPMYKIFHVPSLKAFVVDGQPYLGKEPDAPCNQALKAAIQYAGANSLTAEECQTRYGKSREQLVSSFRQMVDVALYKADALTTTDLATLQALVTYVTSVRILDCSRRTWTLIALLDRIARAMNIHKETSGESIYTAELKRRLWHAIVFVDCYGSVDRGSEPTIHPDTFTRLLPSNVNDEDFGPASTSLAPREGLTEMTLYLVAARGSSMHLRTHVLDVSTLGEQTWQKRLELAYAYQKDVYENHIRHLDLSIPLHREFKGIAEAACHQTILRAVRPMQLDATSAPPRVDSPWVMALAVNILRQADELWQQMGGAWRRMPWAPWHAIAVALASLCSMRGTPEANEAWDLVDKGMSRFAVDVADGPSGMLWKPITKLYKKAATFRDGGQTTQAAPIPPSMEDIAWNDPFLDPQFAANPALVGMTMNDLPLNTSDSMFSFPPDMASMLPTDDSWLDWEGILKDIDEVKADDMQWM
ncbi:unnamed protein product [Zymoseptoria tritici ST99CH_1E4]|uniref:Zn(2)-C6 fungal-type domain-containing protein n=1 Tax=Zymoseptoria tritici ST99CH_1E4 TaxID=1276532 RepID=A0A2H1FJ20_ZYMTR|nr:unnamed protein product [Zymoseptoria tritici ST99CH_1E4]